MSDAEIKSSLYIPIQGALSSFDVVNQGPFAGMTAGMVADGDFPPSLIAIGDVPNFHIGQSYEKKPAKAIFCTQCGRNEFNIARASYYTAIRCVYCEWELCIHDG